MLPAVRFVRLAVLASVLVAVLVSVALVGRSPSSPQSLSAVFGGGTEQTPWGPLTASDRDMLIKVRQANLWEGPSGEQAAQRAGRASVREVGRKLGVEHAQLDADLRVVADKLGLDLPSQPSDAQKVWMAEISAASPANYDTTFVNIVRSAHGEVMPLVDGVRSGTGNSLVRAYAVETAQFIDRHMGYLESTGLVNYQLFPPSTAPAARLIAIGGYNVPITLLLFAAAVLIGAALLRGLSRHRVAAAPAAPPGWRRHAARGAARLGEALDDRVRRRPVSRRAVDRPADDPDGEQEPAMVTTAELIALLNPADAPDVPPDTWGRGGEAEARPVGSRSGGPVPPPRMPCDSPVRTPPRLGRARGTRRW